MIKLNLSQTRYLRARAQHLTEHNSQSLPEKVVQAVFGVQAQELPSAYLSIRARGRGMTEDEIKTIHFDRQKLAWTWCMRGTLHLVTAQDVRWLTPLLKEDLIPANRRRLLQLGWTDDTINKGIRVILDLLHGEDEVTRAQIAGVLEKNNLPFKGQATVHILFRSVIEGLVTIAGLRGAKPTYGLFDRHFSSLEPLPREEAIGRLANRYLEAYGPATVRDFAVWSGLKISDIRPTWNALTSRTSDVDIEGTTAQVFPDRLAWLEGQTDQEPSLRLLPRYDTYLLGYAHRGWTVDSDFESRLFPGGGIISAVIVLDGLVVGVWKLIPGKQNIKVEAEIFKNQPASLFSRIEDEVADIRRFYDREIDLKLTRKE